jgi:hypothetical protein
VTGGSKAFKCANCYEVFLDFDLEKVDIVPLVCLLKNVIKITLFQIFVTQITLFFCFCELHHIKNVINITFVKLDYT